MGAECGCGRRAKRKAAARQTSKSKRSRMATTTEEEEASRCRAAKQFKVDVWSVGAEHWWQWWRYGRCGWRVRVVDTDKSRGACGEVGMLVAWAVRKEECKRL